MNKPNCDAICIHLNCSACVLQHTVLERSVCWSRTSEIESYCCGTTIAPSALATLAVPIK